jgi:hypothetical protein
MYTNSAKEMSHGFFDGNSRIVCDELIFSGDFKGEECSPISWVSLYKFPSAAGPAWWRYCMIYAGLAYLGSLKDHVIKKNSECRVIQGYLNKTN